MNAPRRSKNFFQKRSPECHVRVFWLFFIVKVKTVVICVKFKKLTALIVGFSSL